MCRRRLTYTLSIMVKLPLQTKNKNIQILRAYAVLLVIFFHLNISQFEFGYLGVDIFLVISGYFMAEIYKKTNFQISALDFYKKRIRRIFPHYFIVLVLTFFTFFIVLLPHERVNVIEQLFTSIAFVSNIYFWLQDQYFSNGTFRPYLHTWSLALEVQFYLIVPFIMRLARIRLLISIFSFILYIFVTTISPATAFYLLPTRLWEFTLGIFISLNLERISKYFKFSVFWANLLVISLIPITIYLLQFTSFNNQQSYPVVIVVFVTCISLCLAAKTASLHSTLLSKIGDVSYELYLVHLPVISFLAYKPFMGTIPLALTLKALSAATLISWLLYVIARKFALKYQSEQKFRKLISIWIILALLSLLLYQWRLNVSSAFYSGKVSQISYSAFDRESFRCGILSRVNGLDRVLNQKNICYIGNIGNAKKAILIGDSHADSIKNSLAKVLNNAKIDLILPIQNQTLNETNIVEFRGIVQKIKPQFVFFHYYTNSTDLRVLKNFINELFFLDITVIFISDVPSYDFNVPLFMFEQKNQVQFTQEMNLQTYYARNVKEFNFFKYMSSENLFFIDSGKALCNKFSCRIANHQGRPLYVDSGHLTLSGSEYLFGKLKKELQGILD